MLFKSAILFLGCLLSTSSAMVSAAPPNKALEIRNAPRVSFVDTSREPHWLRSLAPVKRNTVFKNSTTLDKSWSGAVLFSFKSQVKKGNASVSAGVEIVCTTCYIKGTATAQLTVDGSFNISQAFRNFTSQIEHDIENITTSAIDYVTNQTSTIITDIVSGDFDLTDLDFPTIPLDFDIDIPDIPECQLSFQFDGLELYMQLDTALSGGATYTLNLYTSETPIGVASGQDNEIGIIFAIDLILSVEAEIDISSGFHIKLNDGVAINIAMFGQNISSVTLNGGQFEFLPVTVQSAGIVFSALLRIGAKAGLGIGSPEFSFSSGAEVGVWANIAEFITNVTAAPSTDTSGCKIIVEEVYSMAIGAQAGATLAIADHTWGPTPNTSTVLFYTTLASICAGSTTSTSAALTARAAAATGLTTTTISTKITYTGTACRSTGLINCPVSLQTTSKYTTTSTLVTSVPSGSKATFPATTQNSVASMIAFGTNVKALASASGTPTSYVPAATSTSRIVDFLNGKTGGVSNKIILGISIGVGVPVFIAIVAGSIWCIKRKRSIRAQRHGVPYQQARPRRATFTPDSQRSIKKGSSVTVRGLR